MSSETTGGRVCSTCGQLGHSICDGTLSRSGMLGWVCPKCGAGVSPYVLAHCDFRHARLGGATPPPTGNGIQA